MKNTLLVNQFNPTNWHGLVNEWMRNHRRTKTPLAQATRSTLVLMHGATNRAGYELYSFIEFVFESLHSSLLFRKLKESIFGASWKHILEEEASKIFTRRSCLHFRLSGERIIQTTRSCASLRTLDRQGRAHFRREHLEASQVSLRASGAQLKLDTYPSSTFTV